ncbi:AAA family ATPase [Brevundimonas sp.]|uniref:AAA family ATPase n=1 Tax=Brevundimonas sp. TaxID=1871086 RepID=UPI0025C016E7|nr:AAA family ATPase [Brevundimonas sp.]
MTLVFIYGPVASGKLTVAHELAKQTGLPLFHNHLVVDAVNAVFAFGTEPFIRLREAFWLQTFIEAAREGRSLIFTFAPEGTVAEDFPSRVQAAIAPFGGSVIYVSLTVSPEEQERRLIQPSRAAFGKLQSIDLLRQLRTDYNASLRIMPQADLTIDTEACTPQLAAERIASHLAGR